MRCFLAVELDAEVREQLRRLQTRMSVLGRAVRWARPEQMHLTLKFLGEVPDADVPAVCEVATAIAARSRPCEIRIAETGCFPPGGGVRIIWAGIVEPTGQLAACRDAAEESYADLGFEREHRAFRPHLTIGRVKDARRSAEIRRVVADQVDFDAGLQRVAELVLFQSHLVRSGATYTPIARAPLEKRSGT